MQVSKYLKSFSAIDPSVYELIGDALMVERLPPEEKRTKSGIIIDTGITDNRQVGTIGADKPLFVHVLAAGKGFYNEETGEDVPLSVVAGDIILIGLQSVKWFSMLEINGYEPYTIGLSRESEIQLRFRGPEAYQQYFDSINGMI